MNLRELEYLVALSEHRHFGEAAAACFVSQPTLSTQIKRLERELGVILVERNPRHVTMTPAGERIVEAARETLAHASRITALARAARDPESGSLQLGLFPTVAPYLLAHVVAPLHERFPHLELLLREEKSERLEELLRDGRLDGVVLARPVRDDSFTEQSLFTEQFVLAVPRGHELAARATLEVAELKDHEVLLLDEGHCLRDQALSVCTMVGAHERRGFRATSLETLRQMVAAGVGVTLLPRLAVAPPVPESDEVVIVALADPVPAREIALYWRRTSPLAELLERVGAVMRDAVASIDGVTID